MSELVPKAMLTTADGSLPSELWPWVRMLLWLQAAVRPPGSLVLCPVLQAPGCRASHLIRCRAGLVSTQCCIPASLPRLLSTLKLQEKERNKGGQKKSLTSLQQLEEEGFSEQSDADVNMVKTIQLPLQLAVPIKAGMRLTPRQLEKYQDVLEKLLAEMLQDTPDAD
ncbi:uncharacterized protein LOC129196442 isoform X1 [Grus americana]|uniref:uncharacterized protein LOC129196442 isoform X1 n=1 Tax=Grus americana TaxID=9117 RepID=UPI002407ACB6|nr:uncharacterized protein LOC129196442 isoform X1 [Grus americana]